MGEIRMIVSDLDGTLLDDSHRICEKLVERISEYTANGGLFTIATGRNWYATKDIVEKLSINLPVILCNGAVLADKSGIYYKSEIAIDRMVDLLMEAKNKGLSVLLFEHDIVYGFGSRCGIKRFCDKEKVFCEVIKADKDYLVCQNILKVVLVGSYEISTFLWQKHRMDENGQYSFMQSESDFFEIVKSGENKGKTMLELASRLGVQKQNILAIGNHMNDKEMILEAGIGAAVSNSFPDLKLYADFICENAWDKGVIEVMDKFCKIPGSINFNKGEK